MLARGRSCPETLALRSVSQQSSVTLKKEVAPSKETWFYLSVFFEGSLRNMHVTRSEPNLPTGSLLRARAQFLGLLVQTSYNGINIQDGFPWECKQPEISLATNAVPTLSGAGRANTLHLTKTRETHVVAS